MLEKTIKIDQIEIVGDFKAVQVRTATIVTDDGVELSRSFHRHVVSAGDDYSNETDEVQRHLRFAIHTDELSCRIQEKPKTDHIEEFFPSATEQEIATEVVTEVAEEPVIETEVAEEPIVETEVAETPK
jgi:hypothetical protein